MAAPALHLRGLAMEYVRGKPVLRGIDLEVGSEGLMAIIGPSGTGKSTLIRCINRLVDPTAGEILFQGQDLARLRGEALRHARRRIGMVFQEYNLVERLSVMENVLSGRLGYVSPWKAWMRKYPREDIDRAFELLDLVGLSAFPNQRADSLSGGQRQRVGVARALAAAPSILLMDEPFGALDPVTRAKLGDDYKKLHSRLGLTTVMVTHDVTEAVLMADQIVVMDGGEVIAQDTPAALLKGHKNKRVNALFDASRRQARRMREVGDE